AGAAAHRLGVPLDRQHANARFTCLPAASQARAWWRPLRDQRVGSRLPADRRAGDGMSEPLALAGWALAFAALATGALVGRELSRRMELVARACHELRGPLTAARLGL